MTSPSPKNVHQVLKDNCKPRKKVLIFKSIVDSVEKIFQHLDFAKEIFSMFLHIINFTIRCIFEKHAKTP